MSNETKVGLFAIIIIILSVIGYNFLKGLNLLSSSTLLYATYPNVNSLTISSPVFINGLEVGVVKDIYFKNDLQTLEVEMSIENDFRIPKETEAVITSTSLMGGVAIYLKYETICEGGNCAQSGDHLKGRVASVLETFIGDSKEVRTYMREVRDGVGPVVDSIKAHVNDPNSDDNISKSIRDMAIVLENLKQSTAELNRAIAQNRGAINGTLQNVQSVTGNLAQQNHKISEMLSNANTLSSKLKGIEVEATLDSVNLAISGLKTTLNTANGTVGQLNEVVSKINNGEGTIGRLMADDSALNQLLDAAISVDTLFADIKKRPYRYMPFKKRKKVLKYDKQDGIE